jgi:penicillin-binding protein 2
MRKYKVRQKYKTRQIRKYYAKTLAPVKRRRAVRKKDSSAKGLLAENLRDDAENKVVSSRLAGLGVFCVLLFMLLAFNLWHLQIVNFDYYAEKAMGNVLKPTATSTVRGPIVDKNGVVLAKSVSDMALVLDWTELQSQSEQWQSIIKRLAHYVKPYWPYPQQSPELIAEDICVMIRNQQWKNYKPVVVMEDVPESLRAVVAEHSNELPGVRVEPLAKRVYPNGTLMGQVLGYVREISPEELDAFNAAEIEFYTDGMGLINENTGMGANNEESAGGSEEYAAVHAAVDPVNGAAAGPVHAVADPVNDAVDPANGEGSANSGEVAEDTNGFIYRQGDLVGKMGVEKSFDLWLRGREGLDRVEIDKHGRPVSRFMVQPPQVGSTVYLTIDSALQRDVEQSLDEVIERVQRTTDPKAGVGTAVVIEVKTGKILAMVSKPYMDPNDLVGIMSNEMADRYFTGSEAATKNRAIMEMYPPGSVYKMLVASSALQLGVITPEDTVYGSLSSLGPGGVQAQAAGEWGGNHFGWVNLYRGLAKSSNIYFQSIGRRVFDADPEYMRKIGNEFGFGVRSGIELPGEVAGIAPSPQWKEEYFGPAYEARYQERLQEIEDKYLPLLSQAKGQSEISELEAKKKSEAGALTAEYEANKKYYVDWRLSDSFYNSIGQGYNANTLLQLANYVATIANGGTNYKPQIVEKIVDTVTGEVIKEYEPEVLNRVSISPENLTIIREAMSLVTKGEGTAAFVFADMPNYSGGGKTGTAQVGNKDDKNYFKGTYVAYAPYDDPEIAVAVMVEYGGTGGDTAGRVAKAAFKSYFGW